MATRDPNFWKRFSIAAHQDALEKEEMNQQKTTHEPKHSYVPSSHLSSTPPSPSSGHEMFTPTFSPIALSFPTTDEEKPLSTTPVPEPTPDSPPPPKRPRSTKLQKTPSQRALIRPPPALTLSSQKTTSIYTTTTSTTRAFAFAPPSPLPLSSPYPPFPSSNHLPLTRPQPPYLHTHTPSTNSLNLSTRPPSRFKFWTTISADPPLRRDSWLAGQKRKARQRVWLCWLFWGVLLGVGGAVVIAVVVLRGKGVL